MLELQLKRLGHSVALVDDGRQALRLCLATPFDVIFSGLNLSGLKGCQWVRALRLHELRRKFFPSLIVGLTARHCDAGRERGLLAGMDHCLAKPLSMTQLQTLLWSHDKYGLGVPGLEITELERLAAGDGEVMGELLQLLIDTNTDDLRALRQCAVRRDLPGAHALAHRIKGAVRMVHAQKLIAACQVVEDQCLATQPAIAILANALRKLSLEVQRLVIGLRRCQANRLRSDRAATISAGPPVPRR